MIRTRRRKILLALIVLTIVIVPVILVQTSERLSTRRILLENSISLLESRAECYRELERLRENELQTLSQYRKLLITVQDKPTADAALGEAKILDKEIRSILSENHDVLRRVKQASQSWTENSQEREKENSAVIWLSKRCFSGQLEARHKKAVDEALDSSVKDIEHRISQGLIDDEIIQAHVTKNSELARIRELINSNWHEEWMRLTDLKALQDFGDSLRRSGP